MLIKEQTWARKVAQLVVFASHAESLGFDSQHF